MRTSRLLPIIVAAAAVLLLPGCSRVKDDWKAAQGADTSEAYQDFLQQHPDSEFARLQLLTLGFIRKLILPIG